ncbi:PHP domain-containing protein, partial [Sphingobacterium luzhongxinii]
MLNLHSYFSLRYGTLRLEDLVEGLLATGHDTAVLTDINNSSGSLDLLRLGMKAGLNILAGMEFRNKDELLYIGIARNNEGFRQLNELMTTHNREASRL